MRVLMIALRIVCYLVTAAVVAAGVAVWLLNVTGACSSMNEARIACGSEVAQSIAEASISVLLFTAFLGLPLLFVLGGVIFFIVDIVRFLRRRRGSTPA